MILAGLLAALVSAAPAAGLAADRALLADLVSINTVHGEGSCTAAADRIERELRGGGYVSADIIRFAPEGAPAEGGLVATLPGRDPKAAPILLLGHLDTVPARRTDWQRDPFQVTEQDGQLIGRGVVDMKSLIAVWTGIMLAERAGVAPRHTLRLVLTCGEEGRGINGLQWLIAHQPDLLRAGYALNEGGWGRRDQSGRPVALHFHILEKTYADFRLVVTNRGGHSSVPRPDNAIHTLAAAVGRLAAHRFPTQLNATTRQFLLRTAETTPRDLAAALKKLADDPGNADALARVAQEPALDATLRNTCVTTRLDAGHANNALAQRAEAIVNCRLLPGETLAETTATLRRVVADPAVRVEALLPDTPPSPDQPLPERIIAHASDVAGRHFPGVPLIPIMTVSASDAPALIRAGVPTYGVPGLLLDADGGNMHGVDEHLAADAFAAGRLYLRDLVKVLANAP
jgi:acetylornithine deacetylase/succinyl-diaminopimelate desuccinylase-like protein